jgi:hypothetical protein
MGGEKYRAPEKVLMIGTQDSVLMMTMFISFSGQRTYIIES